MPSKLVDDALKRNPPEQQRQNQATINVARRNIDGKTMKEVDEVTAPKPHVGRADPSGAARDQLSPDFREKIERIQQGGRNYYGPEATVNNDSVQDIEREAAAASGGVDELSKAGYESHMSQSVPPDPEIEY